MCFNLGPEVSYMIGESISSNFDYTNPSAVDGFPSRARTEQLAMEVKTNSTTASRPEWAENT